MLADKVNTWGRYELTLRLYMSWSWKDNKTIKRLCHDIFACCLFPLNGHAQGFYKCLWQHAVLFQRTFRLKIIFGRNLLIIKACIIRVFSLLWLEEKSQPPSEGKRAGWAWNLNILTNWKLPYILTSVRSVTSGLDIFPRWEKLEVKISWHSPFN